VLRLRVVAIELSDVQVIIEREILPAIINDNPPIGNTFHNWKFQPFQADPASTRLVGKVSAVRESDGLIFWSNVTVYRNDLEQPVGWLMTLLDQKIKGAVEFIVNYLPEHKSGVLCENVACEKCYA